MSRVRTEDESEPPKTGRNESLCFENLRSFEVLLCSSVFYNQQFIMASTLWFDVQLLLQHVEVMSLLVSVPSCQELRDAVM